MTDLDEARRRLEAERERIRARMAGDAAVLPGQDGAPIESGYATHAADRATDTFEEEKALGLRAHFRGELDAVEEALRRVADGSYGRCGECGAEIPPERLAAMPAARLCIACQRRAEARR